MQKFLALDLKWAFPTKYFPALLSLLPFIQACLHLPLDPFIGLLGIVATSWAAPFIGDTQVALTTTPLPIYWQFKISYHVKEKLVDPLFITHASSKFYLSTYIDNMKAKWVYSLEANNKCIHLRTRWIQSAMVLRSSREWIFVEDKLTALEPIRPEDTR